MIIHFIRSREKLLLVKRLVFAKQTENPSDPHETAAIKERLSPEAPDGESIDVNGKAKEVATEIKAVFEKVEPLGTVVFDQFKKLLSENGIGDIGTAGNINAEDIQKKLNTKVERLNEANIDTLKKLDQGMETLLFRVEMRKDLASVLDGLGGEQVAEKNQIGTLFEEKIKAMETGLEPSGEYSDFAQKRELLHEFTKYSKLLNETRSTPLANTLQTAKFAPSLGVSYQGTGGPNYFKYWSEIKDGIPVVYAFDKRNARIQKFDTAGPCVGRDAWKYVDTAGGEYARLRNTNGTPTPELQTAIDAFGVASEQELATMLNNQQRERAFIKPEDRNYNATPEERGIYTHFETRFSALQAENKTEYNQDFSNAPVGNYMRKLYSEMKGEALNQKVSQLTQPTETTENSSGTRLQTKPNPEVKENGGVFELSTGIISKDKVLLEFDELPDGATIEMNPVTQPKIGASNTENFGNIYREHILVENNQIKFVSTPQGRVKQNLNPGLELRIPIQIKRGDQTEDQMIRLQIKAKPEPVPDQVPNPPRDVPQEGQPKSSEVLPRSIKIQLDSFKDEVEAALSLIQNLNQEKATALVTNLTELSGKSEGKTTSEIAGIYGEMIAVVNSWINDTENGLTETQNSIISGVIEKANAYLSQVMNEERPDVPEATIEGEETPAESVELPEAAELTQEFAEVGFRTQTIEEAGFYRERHLYRTGADGVNGNPSWEFKKGDHLILLPTDNEILHHVFERGAVPTKFEKNGDQYIISYSNGNQDIITITGDTISYMDKERNPNKVLKIEGQEDIKYNELQKLNYINVNNPIINTRRELVKVEEK